MVRQWGVRKLIQGRRLATFVMPCKTSEKTVPALTQGADSRLTKPVGAEETEELDAGKAGGSLVLLARNREIKEVG